MRLRAVLYTEDDAVSVASRLIRGGFEAAVVRERLAGEDDDQDHPWAVVTDAPALVVEVLVDTYDGWLEDPEEPGPAGPPPPGLPLGPRRVRRPFAD